MSLDVYLVGAPAKRAGSGIFVREDGATREISREEWDAKFPGQEPVVFDAESDDEIYSRNITHNVGKMAREAGLYEPLWRPDEIGITRAAELIEPLTIGLARLRADPERFKTFNPSNGWGSYEGLVAFVNDYLSACKDSPDALVHVSR